MPTCTFFDRNLYYDDIGDGVPVVFIHPPGMGRVVFQNQRSLAESFRIILPDLGGHGDSINSANFASIETFVEEVKAILDHIGISSCVLVGYSAGGIIAQEFVYRYPDTVISLVLAGGYPKVTSQSLKLMHLLGMKMVKNKPDRLIKVLAKAHSKEKEFQQTLIRHMEKANTKIWYQFYKQSLYYDGLDRIERITMPLLLIYGKKSDWVNSQSGLFEDCKQQTMRFIPKASHQLPTLFYEPFNSILVEELNQYT